MKVTEKSKNQEISRLESDIRLHRYLYYNKQPRISDQAYDALVERLKQLNPDSEVLKEVGAPADEHSGWQKAQHSMVMASLANAMTVQDFDKWVFNVKAVGKVLVLEDKLDGSSIELNYEKGELIQAITRGDSRIGEDITINVKKMKYVQTTLKEKITASLRGEIMLFNQDFDEINATLDKPFANPRNAANGIAKRFDGNFCDKLCIVLYDMISSDVTFSYETEKLDYMAKTLNLVTINYKLVTPQEVIKIREQYTKTDRANLPYNIDGLVIKINSIQRQKDLGRHPNGDPKGQVAFKFDARGVATTILDCVLEVGRTGVITPNAVFDPINIDGSTVKAATLHNFDEIARLGVGIGDTVVVVKAGEIIPKVVEVIKHVGNKILPPTQCPACKGPVVKDDEGAHLYCDNDNCVGKEFRKLRHFTDVLKKRMSLTDIGHSTVEQLFEKGLVKDPADFYTLTMTKVASLDRSGDKSAKKIVDGFERCKEMDIVTFLMALAIPTLGETMAETITDEYDLFALTEEVTEADLSKISGIGPSRAHDILEGLSQRRDLIEKLMQVGVKIKKSGDVKLESTKLQGKSFQVTGPIVKINPKTNKSYKREEWYDFVKANGGEIKRVGKELMYLIANRSSGNKLSKASSMGIKVISEDDFWKMIEE